MKTTKLVCVIGVTIALVAGPSSSAFAADDAGIIETILEDAAQGTNDGDAIVADVDDVTATIPLDVSEPLTLQADGGAEILMSLPASSGMSAVDADAAAVTHVLDDGSSILPLVRSNGVLQVLSVIPDDASPASFVYGLTAGEGSSLVALSDGSVELVDAAGEPVAVVAAPWATDAAGKTIETWFTTDGGWLTQVVDLEAAGDVTYPVVADPAASVTYTKYTATDVSKTYNWTNKSKQIGICKVLSGAGGGTCSISNSYSVSTSIQTSLGASVSDVSASIGFNSSKTVTGTITWTSGEAPVGSSFKAWATGTRATYKVQKWTGTKLLGQKNVNWRVVSTSGTLTAFSPVVGFSVGQ